MRSKRRNYAVSLKNSICTIWLWDPNVIIYTAKSFNLVFLSITITQILFAIANIQTIKKEMLIITHNNHSKCALFIQNIKHSIFQTILAKSSWNDSKISKHLI